MNSDYGEMESLGKGAFSRVSRFEHKKSKVQLAVKIFRSVDELKRDGTIGKEYGKKSVESMVRKEIKIFRTVSIHARLPILEGSRPMMHSFTSIPNFVDYQLLTVRQENIASFSGYNDVRSTGVFKICMPMYKTNLKRLMQETRRGGGTSLQGRALLTPAFPSGHFLSQQLTIC